jgi:hypothetical protein
MKTYRAYILTFEGEVVRTIDLVCETDWDAKAQAEKLVGESPVEVWLGGRRIARFSPKH